MNAERPFLRSYWALPGQLVAGFYPGHFDPAKRDQKLVAAGVTLSVNLMEADEKDQKGAPFADYSARFLEMAEEAGRAVRMERFEIRGLTAHAREAFWPTPQTAKQCQFIRDWNHANA